MLGGFEIGLASLLKATGYSIIPAISINSRVLMQLVLDLLFLSPWHPLGGDPTVLTQARITLTVQVFSLVFMTGVTIWFFAQLRGQIAQFHPAYKSVLKYIRLFRPVLRFKRLVKHSVGPLFEVTLRNGVYLWLVVGMVQMGQEYAAAWDVFNAMRWSIVMIPVLAVIDTISFITGQRWATVLAWYGKHSSSSSLTPLGTESGSNIEDLEYDSELTDSTSTLDKASQTPIQLQGGDEALPSEDVVYGSDQTPDTPHSDALMLDTMCDPMQRLLHVSSPMIILGLFVVIYELLMWLGLAFGGAESFAKWLTNSDEAISALAAEMWKAIDWTYLFFAASSAMSGLVLALSTSSIFWPSLISNAFWMAPWAIYLGTNSGYDSAQGWKYAGVVFGGVNLVNFAAMAVIVLFLQYMVYVMDPKTHNQRIPRCVPKWFGKSLYEDW